MIYSTWNEIDQALAVYQFCALLLSDFRCFIHYFKLAVTSTLSRVFVDSLFRFSALPPFRFPHFNSYIQLLYFVCSFVLSCPSPFQSFLYTYTSQFLIQRLTLLVYLSFLFLVADVEVSCVYLRWLYQLASQPILAHHLEESEWAKFKSVSSLHHNSKGCFSYWLHRSKQRQGGRSRSTKAEWDGTRHERRMTTMPQLERWKTSRPAVYCKGVDKGRKAQKINARAKEETKK